VSAAAAALQATGLGRRYGRTWALREATLDLPEGAVVALVGPNGAGKTTFLSLVMGLAEPTEGTVTVHGHPAGSARALAEVAFLAQDHPLYKRFTVADHLRMGRSLNDGFDAAWARARLDDLGIALDRPAGRLSGGQQSQVALTLALAKRARVLLLDEPVASLDPLARRDVMRMLLTRVAETGTTVVFSSHVVAELERVCDHLVVISRARVQLLGETERLIAAHARLIGPGGVPAPAGVAAILEQAGDATQQVLLARLSAPVIDPRWESRPVTIEEIALGYLSAPAEGIAASLMPPRRLIAATKGRS
jgi:ABC-2 type transport system ATP-binding protein